MTLIETRQRQGREVHGPQAVPDFFEGYILADQGTAQEEDAVAPPDAPVTVDAADLEMPRVFNRREGARQGAGGPSIGATEDQAEAAEDPAGGASAASG